jgi:hypothetical protein
VTGPSAEVAAFRAAASGPGAVAWRRDYQRLEEDWVHELLPPLPADRGISVQGARVVGGRKVTPKCANRLAPAGRAASRNELRSRWPGLARRSERSPSPRCRRSLSQYRGSLLAAAPGQLETAFDI